jgi:tripartite-type tricarboxylate transporter receptor subunit TctC
MALGLTAELRSGDAMQLRKREFLRFTAAVAMTSALPDVTRSQSYPVRPARVIVGFPAGGGVDVVARIIAQSLSTLGQPFVVENRPGAGSNIATEVVATASPDGYTLLLISVSAAINAAFDRNLAFNLTRDIVPVAGIMRVPGVMEVGPSFPGQTVPEFIAYAKANPDKINMASAGSGTLQHLCGEMFKQMTGVQMVHVPYGGSPAALTAVMAGEAQVTFDPLPSSIELIRSGKLRALAVTSATRVEALPEIATVADYVSGFEANAWYGLGAPGKTSATIVQDLNVAVNDALAEAAIRKRLSDLGGNVMPGPPSLFGKLIADEVAKWQHVIRAAGITPG